MDAPAPLVLVTGANGYIASWCVAALLQAGYRVRGTVRSIKNDTKSAFLRALCPRARFFPIELVEADLLVESGWDAAVKGCTYVLHLASPFVIEEPKDADSLVRPAVNGTLAVLRAVRDMEPPRAKRVVVMSSFAAIGYGVPQPLDHVFTELDKTDPDGPGVGAYVRSKALAEFAAWEFMASLPPTRAKQFELATVNPVFVLGPSLGGRADSGSAEVIAQMVTGKLPALARVPVSVVDVRDVVLTVLGAMTQSGAAGQRYLTAGAQTTVDQLALPLAASLSSLGYRVTSFVAPDFLLKLAAFFDKAAASAASQLGHPKLCSSSKAASAFGIEFNTNFGALAVELARSLIANGQIEDKSAGAVLSVHLPAAERGAYITPHVPGLEKYALKA